MSEFNAFKGLEGFVATESQPSRTGRNALPLGQELIFEDTGKTAPWGKNEWPLVATKDGIECNSPYIACCMIERDGVILNQDKNDDKFLCMHNPRSAEEAGIEFDYVQNHVNQETQKFPKMKVIKTLPVAIKRTDLIANARESTKQLYQQIFGTTLDKLDCEYLPSYKKSQYSNGDPYYSIKCSIVTLP